MPTVQGAFPIKQDAFVLGQAAKSRYASDALVVQAAPIAFGAAVMRGTDPGGISTFAAGAGAFLGILGRDQGRPAQGNTDGTVQVGAPAAYFTSGHAVVLADKAIAAVDVQANWNTATGRWTDAAVSATVLATTWSFDSIATAAGQLVVVRR